ncbi:hypothetical protein H5410_061167 [Solanum commersonii]|uniref:Uncharacterized protein n=1 Tax=Solanum commersonii TaxID=4109 RepID=A0A9J5W7E0_SOLCO|nr:hypothetical protein H5410_061167 [Solanum commersonii]
MKNLQHPLPISWNWKSSSVQYLSKNILYLKTYTINLLYLKLHTKIKIQTLSEFVNALDDHTFVCFITFQLLPLASSRSGSVGDIRYNTASWNCWTTHRLLLFIADLIFSFRAQHNRTLASKTQVWQFKKDVWNSATQESIMNAHTRLNLLMRRSNVHSKIQVVTHHYQRISSLLYLLQMQVQAQQRK